MPFIDLMQVEYDEMDSKLDSDAEFDHKFNLITREFNFEFYAKTKKERDIWVEALYRAIEAKYKNLVTNWAEDCKNFEEAKKKNELKPNKKVH